MPLNCDSLQCTLNSLGDLIELAEYLKQSFTFVLLDSELQYELAIHWNIQYMDLGVLSNSRNRDLIIFLEVIIVQKSLILDLEEANLIVSILKTKFTIEEEPMFSTIEKDGEKFMITKMHDILKKDMNSYVLKTFRQNIKITK